MDSVYTALYTCLHRHFTTAAVACSYRTQMYLHQMGGHLAGSLLPQQVLTQSSCCFCSG
jgi:hypothetical protein